MTLIDALWIGPYGCRKAPEGTLMETGITVCKVGLHEAAASDHWQPVGDVQLPQPEPEPEQPVEEPAPDTTAEVS